MPLSSTRFAGVAAAIAGSLGVYHFVVLGPRLRTISRLVEMAVGNQSGESIARLQASQNQFLKRTEERLAELERVARREVHRVGFVRYNSFADTGTDLSFTLAMLNVEGDGVVLTSIYSREDTRTYAKAVRKFVPQQGASKEEQAAIAMARNGSTV